uniref:Uncharacterized protein n=1 Tax=Romanomermis culicivorax TaxID=13658 RepID=A0A915L5Y0_ROMCU
MQHGNGLRPTGCIRESMVTTFSAMRDASMMIKGPMKSGWILFTFPLLVKRTRSLTKFIFCEENQRAFCGVVNLERGGICGHSGIGSLC